MSDLVRFEAMKAAIAECHSVDETLQIHSQAAALEAAARVAMDTENERRCIDIRIRAERRAGQLMDAMQKNPVGRPKKNSATAAQFTEAIERSGIPRRTAERWQQLAKVSEERFEAHMASDEKPSSRAIIESVKAKPQMSEEALWLWGRLRDFERMGVLDIDPSELIGEMTDEMRKDVRRLAPLVVLFITRCTEREVA